MSLFASEHIYKYLFTVVVILMASVMGARVREFIDENIATDTTDYKLIKEFLLSDGDSTKPCIWIHSKHERNARDWHSFNERGSNDLNEPYIHFTIKSIIMENHKDFNICVIDDESFAKLIPKWRIEMSKIPEPFKDHCRRIGFLMLVEHYGGIVVPNSFLCLRPLIDIYKSGVSKGVTSPPSSSSFSDDPSSDKNIPFVAENINYGDAGRIQLDEQMQMKKNNLFGMLFAPDMRFFGCRKRKSPVIQELIEKMENIYPYNKGHFSSESKFFATSNEFLVTAIQERKMKIISGQYVGVMTSSNNAIKNLDKKPILLEEWLQDEYVDLSPYAIGIWIDNDVLLRRSKYNWFAVLPIQQLLKEGGNYALSKYFIDVAQKMQMEGEVTEMDKKQIAMENIETGVSSSNGTTMDGLTKEVNRLMSSL